MALAQTFLQVVRVCLRLLRHQVAESFLTKFPNGGLLLKDPPLHGHVSIGHIQSRGLPSCWQAEIPQPLLHLLRAAQAELHDRQRCLAQPEHKVLLSAGCRQLPRCQVNFQVVDGQLAPLLACESSREVPKQCVHELLFGLAAAYQTMAPAALLQHGHGHLLQHGRTPNLLLFSVPSGFQALPFLIEGLCGLLSISVRQRALLLGGLLGDLMRHLRIGMAED
mmetsp:Transcript_75766/g.181139  ORF Transcript_75766/g.181139 Transcript_75766/m.181139 type:complete len:222 (-) Transcript_75766:34-699(-)